MHFLFDDVRIFHVPYLVSRALPSRLVFIHQTMCDTRDIRDHLFHYLRCFIEVTHSFWKGKRENIMLSQKRLLLVTVSPWCINDALKCRAVPVIASFAFDKPSTQSGIKLHMTARKPENATGMNEVTSHQ